LASSIRSEQRNALRPSRSRFTARIPELAD
jgi:hypothetical protein